MAFGESPVWRIIWEPFYNDSGAVIPAFAAMYHSGETTRGGNFVMKMIKPSTTFYRMFYINGPVDVPIGGYGSCTRYAAYCLCSSAATATANETWGPAPSTWELTEGFPGACILGGSTGDGDDRRAKVVVEPINEVFGSLTSALAQGSTATFDIEYFDGASWSTGGWSDITVRDRLLKTGASNIDSGNRGVARWYSGAWWLEAAECN